MSLISSLFSQNPGLVISEIWANPGGTDSPFEWVELKATANIDFSVTPYSVVVLNNGTATANGWVAGGTVSYGFNISSGSVTAGDVVYVGGSSMVVTGVKLRQIDTGTMPGDGFGTASTGPFGNGGNNADGVAVFNLPVTSLTSSTVPVDAVFYGTGIGSALVNGGADGYQLPVNDLYNGGKLQTGSFFAGDPASDVSIRATGIYNTATSQWAGTRNWTTQAGFTDQVSGITLTTTTPPAQVSITGTVQTVNENAGTVNVPVLVSTANTQPVKVVLSALAYSTAGAAADYTISNDTLTVPANSNGTFNFSFTVNDDNLAERAEYLVLKITHLDNAQQSGNNYQIIYIRDNDYVAPAPNNELKLNLLTSFQNGAAGTNSAEIVSYDAYTQKLYIANSIGAKLDIVDFSNPATPVLTGSISVTPYGNINSVVAHNGIVAAAIENANPQDSGLVVFFDSLGNFVNQVQAGPMPDMITFNKDYTKILTANEGEPNTNYMPDPEGSVTIVDLTPGVASLTQANVSFVSFGSFNGQLAALRAQGIRIFGPGSSVAQDLEPEYIAISEDNQKAYVTLQENNAMAIIDIATASVDSLIPLGTVDYMAGGLDASDQSGSILIASYPVKGLFMPDAIAYAQIGGAGYVFSANEGDAREWNAVTDVARISATPLDSTVFPDQNILKNNSFLGRLNIVQQTGDTDNDGDMDELQVLGTRSFSIWDAATGALVFDSKDLIEQVIAADPVFSTMFNASNSGSISLKNRSDDKGPEPEGVATAVIEGSTYLFVALERIGGVMLFNVDNPAAPVYVGYYNNRTAPSGDPDRGAEGIIYIKPEDSPNGNALVLLANEVSSTISVYQVNTCSELAGANMNAGADSICQNATLVLDIPGDAGSTVQWLLNGQPISGETGNSYIASQPGVYSVAVSSSTLQCSDTSAPFVLTVNPLPVLQPAVSDSAVCPGTQVTLSASADSISWNNGVQNNVPFTPSATQYYTVTGFTSAGCTAADSVQVTVFPAASINVLSDDSLLICMGEDIVLNATGSGIISWSDGVSNGQTITPPATHTYIASVTDSNGCTDSSVVYVEVNALPVPVISFNNGILSVPAGFAGVEWTLGGVPVGTGNTYVPTANGSYTVTVLDGNGCYGSAVYQVATVSLNEQEATGMHMFPNPAAEQVTLTVPGGSWHTVQILSIDGRVLRTQVLNNEDTITLSVQDLTKGSYIVQLSGNENTVRRILVKQ